MTKLCISSLLSVILLGFPLDIGLTFNAIAVRDNVTAGDNEPKNTNVSTDSNKVDNGSYFVCFFFDSPFSCAN